MEDRAALHRMEACRENLAEVLQQRAGELPAPIQMSDALSRNSPKLEGANLCRRTAWRIIWTVALSRVNAVIDGQERAVVELWRKGRLSPGTIVIYLQSSGDSEDIAASGIYSKPKT